MRNRSQNSSPSVYTIDEFCLLISEFSDVEKINLSKVTRVSRSPGLPYWGRCVGVVVMKNSKGVGMPNVV